MSDRTYEESRRAAFDTLVLGHASKREWFCPHVEATATHRNLGRTTADWQAACERLEKAGKLESCERDRRKMYRLTLLRSQWPGSPGGPGAPRDSAPTGEGGNENIDADGGEV